MHRRTTKYSVYLINKDYLSRFSKYLSSEIEKIIRDKCFFIGGLVSMPEYIFTNHFLRKEKYGELYSDVFKGNFWGCYRRSLREKRVLLEDNNFYPVKETGAFVFEIDFHDKKFEEDLKQKLILLLDCMLLESDALDGKQQTLRDKNGYYLILRVPLKRVMYLVQTLTPEGSIAEKIYESEIGCNYNEEVFKSLYDFKSVLDSWKSCKAEYNIYNNPTEEYLKKTGNIIYEDDFPVVRITFYDWYSSIINTNTLWGYNFKRFFRGLEMNGYLVTNLHLENNSTDLVIDIKVTVMKYKEIYKKVVTK